MTQSSRTFRLFVSSTFSDLKAERNALQEKVFPRLRELASAHGCRFQAIDLRWGVSEEAALDQQTMKICLGEIERCQKTSPRPNFIVLLGDRYGWQPLPNEIPFDEFEAILPLTSKEDQKQLNQWYRRDDNAVPAVYDLQPRTGDFEKSEIWEAAETRLRSILQEGIKTLNLSPDALLKYTASATEQEIVAGAMKVVDAQEHVFCFFRGIQGIPDNAAAGAFREADPQAAINQNALKERLRRTLQGNVHEYSASWQDDGPTSDHLDQLCEDVYAELSAVITSEVERLDDIDPLEREISNHEVFGTERSRVFFGREEILNNIEKYISGNDLHPLVVWGASGSGKSALMAKAIELAKKNGQKVIYRFIAATPESSNGRAMLESLCRQISRLYGADENAIPSEYKELVQEFPKRLALAKPDQPLILFLDALDQLSDSDQARNLAWLPSDLPSNVRIVVSTLPGECLEALEYKTQAQNRIEVQPMSIKDGKAILDAWFVGVHRKLQGDQEKYILGKFEKCGLPLYLKLAFEEARLWKSYKPIPELNEDIPGIIRDLFKRLSLESNHGEMMVSRCMSYLAAARNGLSEDELLDVLSRDQEVYRWFLDTAQQTPEDLIKCVIDHFQINGTDTDKRNKAEVYFNENLKPHEDELNKFLSSVLGTELGPKLPIVLWSRLYFDLESYLTERSADGTSLFSFFHTTSFRSVISERYLSGEEKRGRHQILADYFETQPLYRDGEEKQKPNLRKLSEMVYQQAYAGYSDQYAKTLLDYSYLEAKLAGFGVQELIGDYDLVSTAGLSDDKEKTMYLLQDALRLSAHILNKDPFQLPSQLTGRLIGFENEQIRRLLENLQQKIKRPWLRPRSVCLPPPGGELFRTLSGHTATVIDVVITSDDKYAISASYDKTSKVWDLKTGDCIHTLIGHTNVLYDLALSPDNRYAISASSDHTLKIWDLKTGDCCRTLEGHTDLVNHVAITPDGSCAISTSRDKTIKVWNIQSGVCLHTLEGHEGSVNYVAVTSDSLRVVTTSDDHTLRVWDIKKGICLFTMKGHKNHVTRIVLSPDGLYAISIAFCEHSLKVWNLENGRCVGTLIGHTSIVNDVATMQTRLGPVAISASQDKTLKVWNINDNSCLHTLTGHTGHVICIAPSPDGQTVVSSSQDKTLRIWDIETGNCLRTLEGQNSPIGKVVLTSDGSRAISVGNQGDGSLKMWNFNNTGLQQIQREHTNPVNSTVLSPDFNYAISASADQTLKKWSLEKCSCLQTLVGHTWYVNDVSITSDGCFAVSAASDKTLKVWNIKTGSCVQTLTGHTNFVKKVVLTPDNHYVVSASLDKTIKIWEINTGICVRTMEGHTEGINILLITTDGRYIISGSGGNNAGTESYENRILKIWNIENGECIRTLEGHILQINTVALAMDGQHVISGSQDNTIKIWDIENGKCLHTFKGHTEQILQVVVTPDSRCALSASDDNTIKVWDLENYSCLHTLNGHLNGIRHIVLSPNGLFAVSTSKDETIKVWDLEKSSCMATYFIDSGITSIRFTPTGLILAFGSYSGIASFLQLENIDIARLSTDLNWKSIIKTWQEQNELIDTIDVNNQFLQQESLANKAASFFYSYKDYETAANLRIEQIKICREIGNKVKLQEALGQLAIIYKTQNIYDKALTLREEQLKICRELGDKNNLQYALGYVADILNALDKKDEALILYKEREQNCRDLNNKEMLEGALGQQATILFNQKKYDEALPLRREQLEICRSLDNKEMLQGALGQQATILYAQKDFENALPIRQEQLKICRELGDKNNLQYVLGYVADILNAQDKKDEALILYKEREQNCRELNNKEMLLSALKQQATILFNQKKYNDALPLRREQLQICRELGNENNLQLALGFVADILNTLGKKDEALIFYEERVQICRELNNTEMLQSALGQQASILFFKKDFASALDLYKEKTQICRKLGDKDPLQLALGFEADTLKALGHHDKALALYKEREQICRKLNNLFSLQNALGQQAFILFGKKDFKHALKLYQEQENICRELGNKDGIRNSLGNQVLTLKNLGDIKGSEALQKEKELIQ